MPCLSYHSGSGIHHTKVRHGPSEDLIWQHSIVWWLHFIQSWVQKLQFIIYDELFLLHDEIMMVFSSSGFGDRLLSEVKKLAPKDIKIRVSLNLIFFLAFYPHASSINILLVYMYRYRLLKKDCIPLGLGKYVLWFKK